MSEPAECRGATKGSWNPVTYDVRPTGTDTGSDWASMYIDTQGDIYTSPTFHAMS